MRSPLLCVVAGLTLSLSCSPTGHAPAKHTSAAVRDAGTRTRGEVLTRENACRRAKGVQAIPFSPRPTAPVPSRPGEAPSESFVPEQGLSSRRARRVDPNDVCEVADDHLERTESLILRSKATPDSNDRLARAWDKKSPPKYLARISEHLQMTGPELARLHENGFVVLDRITPEAYAAAYHGIFQEELPVFVSIDSILHTVFVGNDQTVAQIESLHLSKVLAHAVTTLRAGLSRHAHGAEPIADLDIVLTVADCLLHPNEPRSCTSSVPGNKEVVQKLVGDVQGGSGLIQHTLFGRPRLIDFSTMVPRGHYSDTPGPWSWTSDGVRLPDYFRGAMWLSRLEFNMVSRDGQSSHPDAAREETPREARAALVLAELAERTGALSDLQTLDEAWRSFAGEREDVSVPELLRLMAQAKTNARDPEAPSKVKAAIGETFVRTTRTHFTEGRVVKLPVIATLLGPRIAADARAFMPFTHYPLSTHMPGAFELGFVLGHTHAKNRIPRAALSMPGFEAGLEEGQRLLREVRGRTSFDLMSPWLGAVTSLADVPNAQVPSFFSTSAFRDFRLNSALVGYGQIRRSFVLMAAQPYDSYGCEIPDGYVEPAPGTYDGLIETMARGASIMKRFDPKKTAPLANYFARAERVLRTLRTISEHELKGQPLSDAERRYLSMVAEYVPTWMQADSGEPPKYTGWFFDLFPMRETDAKSRGDFIADYFTSTQTGQIGYVGAHSPAIGVFVVDAGGEPRAMVGPVARGYEHRSPLSQKRLDDKGGRALSSTEAPWRASHTVAAEPEPPLEGELVSCEGTDTLVYLLRSDVPLGDVTLTLLDHHGDALAQSTSAVGPEGALFVFAEQGQAQGEGAPRTGRPPRPYEGLRITGRTFRGAVSPNAYVLGPFDSASIDAFRLGSRRPPPHEDGE